MAKPHKKIKRRVLVLKNWRSDEEGLLRDDWFNGCGFSNGCRFWGVTFGFDGRRIFGPLNAGSEAGEEDKMKKRE